MKAEMKSFAWSSLAVAVCLSFPNASYAGNFFGGEEKGGLAKAHEAYLNPDFKTMAAEMRKVLVTSPNDPIVRENAFSLLKKAYEIGGAEGIPADWHLPEEITKMRVSVRRFDLESTKYELVIWGDITAPVSIKQLKVTRFPDQVLIDKEAGIGTYEANPPANGEPPSYGAKSAKTISQIPGGLYVLRVELTNGKAVDGWFIIGDDLNASTTPTVNSPAYGETFKTGTPTFSWLDYRSPEYQPQERRSLYVGIVKAEAPKYDWITKWEYYQDSPTTENITIGSTSSEYPNNVTALENGHYYINVKYYERHRFGDLSIGRDSALVRPFTIQK